LGAQDFFKNLISGILIIGEKRFQPGDRIKAGSIHGIVETIGFRSTVVRNFDSSPMLIPNKDLSDVYVTNYGEMNYRRIDWRINLIYSTSVEQLELIRNQIKDYILQSKEFLSDAKFEPVVRVVQLGDSSIDLLIVAYAPKMGFAPFNELKEKLIFKIMHIVKENGSEFAYPSTSLYVESMPQE
jgi:MscS family membrane protein